MSATAVALRVREYRERRKAGLSVFTFTADETAVKEMLKAALLLDENKQDNPEAIEEAMTEFFRRMFERETLI